MEPGPTNYLWEAAMEGDGSAMLGKWYTFALISSF